MATIDERVVNLRFNSSGFQQGVQQSMNLLERFKKTFNLDSQKKNVEDLQNATSRFNFGNMAASGQVVIDRFSNLGVVGLGVLTNLASQAATTGAALAKSLTLDPVIEGFKEYELQMNSIQTILANTNSKGTTLSDVTRVLDDLNQYSDDTIYNFAEMTRNIGTFTAAGVELDRSAMSIKGIANLAAMSGSNSEQASNAMYQLSQAIAQNKVGLMDWNSVVNAGMGGQLFQEALFETGKAMKTLTDVPIGMTFKEWTDAGNSFRDSLQDGWITGEVLTNTLRGFTKDISAEELKNIGYTDEQIERIQKTGVMATDAATKVKTFTQLLDTLKEGVTSGWAQTWQTIFGDFEEAKEMFTGVSDFLGGIIQKWSNGRNDMLKGWKSLGGRTELLEGLKNSALGLFEILRPIGQAFSDIFPPTTSEQLFNATKAFRQFTENLRPAESTIQNIHRTFKGFFAIFSILGQIIGPFVSAMAGIFGVSIKASGGFLAFTAKLGDAIVKFDEVIKKTGVFKTVFGALGKVLQKPIQLLGSLGQKLGKNVLGTDQTNTVSTFEKIANGVNKFVDALSRASVAAGNFVSSGLSKLQNGLKSVQEAIKNTLGGLNLETIFAGLAAGGLGLVLRKILKDGIKFGPKDLGIFDALKEAFEASKDTLEKASEVLDELTNSLKTMQQDVKANIILKIAIAIGILTAAILVLSNIPGANIAKALAGIAASLGILVGGLILLTKATGLIGAAQLPVLATGLILLAVAMVILSKAIENLSRLSLGDMAKGLGGVAAALGIMAAAIKVMPSSSGLISTGLGMIVMAGALLLMSKAVEAFSKMPMGELAKGLGAVAGAIAGVGAASQLMPKNLPAIGVGLLLVSSAMLILTKSIETLSRIPLAELAKGIGAIAATLGLIGVALKLMPSNMVTMGAGLILIGVAMNVLSQALSAMGNMSVEQIGKGLLAMGGGLAIIAVAMNSMPKTLSFMGPGLIAVAVAISIMASALKQMGGMSIEDIGKGLLALGGSLAILAIGLNAMQGAIGGALALMIASAALAVLTPSLVVLGNMSLAQIGTGLLAIAGALAVLGIGAALLSPLIPSMLAMGAALLLISTSALVAGMGMMMLATAMGMLAAPANAGMEGLGNLIMLIPMLLGKLAEGLALFVVTLGKASTDIALAVGKLVSALLAEVLRIITEALPQIGEMLIALGTELLNVITALLPKLGETLSLLFDTLLDLLIELVPKLGELITVLLDEILRIIEDGSPKIADAFLVLLEAILDILAEGIPMISDKALELVIALLDTIANNLGGVIESGVNIILALMQGIGEQTPRLIDQGTQMIIDFINGLADSIRSRGPELGAAAANLGTAIIQGMAGAITSGAATVVNETVDMASRALQAAKNALGIKSPSREFKKVGQYVDEGFALGISSNSGVVQKSMRKMLKDTFETVRDGVEVAGGVLDVFGKGVDLAAKIIDLMHPKPAEEPKETKMDKVSDNTEKNTKKLKKSTKELKESADEQTAAVDKIEENTPRMEEAAEKQTRSAEEIAKAYLELAKHGLDAAKGMLEVVDALNTVVHNVWKSADRFRRRMRNNGRNIGAGVFYGIEEAIAQGTIRVEWATKDMADSVVDIAERRLGVGNGKNQFIEMGEKAATGLAKGLRTWLNLPGSASDKTTRRVLKEVVSEYTQTFSKLIDGVSKVVTAVEGINKVGNMLGIDWGKMFNLGGLGSGLANVGTMLQNGLAGITSMFGPAIGGAIPIIGAAIAGLAAWVSVVGIDELKKIGSNLAGGLRDGISTMGGAISNAFHSILNMENIFDIREWFSIGKNLVGGLIDGVKKVGSSLLDAVVNLGKATLNGIKNLLGIKSPSREFMKIGHYIGEGLAIGIDNSSDKPISSSKQLGEKTRDAIRGVLRDLDSTIDNDIRLRPTITPILDLSNIRKNSKDISGLIDYHNFATEVGYGQARNISRSEQIALIEALKESTKVSRNNKVVFNQYNTSPKALSEIDIYRNTRNQIALAERTLQDAGTR